MKLNPGDYVYFEQIGFSRKRYGLIEGESVRRPGCYRVKVMGGGGTRMSVEKAACSLAPPPLKVGNRLCRP